MEKMPCVLDPKSLKKHQMYFPNLFNACTISISHEIKRLFI